MKDDTKKETKEVKDLIDKEAELPKSVGLKDYVDFLSFGPGMCGLILWFIAAIGCSLL